jgi:hypothetical protein
MSRSLLEWALWYAEQGFRVIPLQGIRKGTCTCGDTGCRSQGKHPLKGSSGATDGTRDEAKLRAWFTGYEVPERNIGLCTEDWLFVVDCDVKPDKGIDGREKWAEIVRQHGGTLPDTPEQISGSGGTHQLFRKPADWPVAGYLGKKPHKYRDADNVEKQHPGDGIDIKTGNAYIVVHPSQNASGTYQWEASSELGAVPIADAPNWLLTLLRNVDDRIQVDTAERLPPDEAKRIKSALNYLDPECHHDDWVAVGMCLQSTRANDEAFAIWFNWSQEAEEKIATRKYARTKWVSFRKEGDGTRTLGTLYAMARAKGWIDPIAEEGAKIAELITRKPRLVLAAANDDVAPGAKLPDLPAETMLATLARWMEQCAGLPQDAATFTAVALACAVAARNYKRGPAPDSPIRQTHGVFLLAGEGGLGLRAIMALQTLYGAVHATHLLQMQRITTAQRLLRLLADTPNPLYLCTDLADVAKLARRQTTNGTLAQVLIEFANAQTLFQMPLHGHHDLGITADKTLQRHLSLHSPSPSMFAPLHPFDLADIHVQQAAIRNIVEGAHIWNCEQTPRRLDSMDVPPWAADAIKAVLRPNPPPGDLSGQLGLCGIHPPTTPYHINSDLPDAPDYAMLTIHEHERALRVSAALAAFEEPTRPGVTKAHATFARDFVIACRSAREQQRKVAESEDGKVSNAAKVLADITRLGPKGANNSKLAAFSRRYKGLSDQQRADLIEQMKTDGDIVEMQEPGRRAPVFVAAVFVADKSQDKKDEKKTGVSRPSVGFGT